MTDEAPEERRCPVCDESVASITVIGPGEAVVAPCGHHVAPDVFD
jgi:hypothetical protein